ncbi:uncharacterized protein LOC144868073 [Branchiostoma floridae x Branchiostoma japonicum]
MADPADDEPDDVQNIEAYSFESEHGTSSEEAESSADEDPADHEPDDVLNIEAYSFEPEHGTSSEEAESSADEGATGEWDGRDVETEEWRLGPDQHRIWCRCGNCTPMPTVRECVCCHDLAELTDPVNERNFDRGGKGVGNGPDELKCVMLHEEFYPICIMRGALRTALITRQNIGLEDIREPLSHRILRLSAYRQFTCWTHKRRLGKAVRRVVPACVVNKIRQQYPSQGEPYTGFLEADD